MLFPLATMGRARSLFGRRLGWRQSYSTISVGWSCRERRTLPEGVGREATSDGIVHRRKRAVGSPRRNRWGFRAWRKTWASSAGCTCTLTQHRRLVNRLGLGQAKHVDMPNLWIQDVPKSGKFVTKNVRGQVNPADLMAKLPPRPQIEQLVKVM